MFLPVIVIAAGDPPDLNWLGPVVGVIGSIIVAAIGGASLVWRRQQDRKEQIIDKQVDAENATQPKVIDGWEEVRKARAEATAYYNLYRFFENAYYVVQSALRKVVRNFREAHPEMEFDKDVVDALALKPPETDGSK